jgi:imidazolonepropionase-like amidohydrolase
MIVSRRGMLRAVRGALTVAAIVASSAVVLTQGGGQQLNEYFTRFGRPAPPPGIAVRAGRMFEARSGQILTNQVILIKNDIITDVGPASQVQIPPGNQIIDLTNATVLPGLIDHHLHLLNSVGGSTDDNDAGFVVRGMALAMQNLIGGYTTVVDMGQDSWALVEMRNGINRGWIPGPRIQMAGPAINPRANGTYTAPGAYVPFNLGPANNNPGGKGSFQNGLLVGPWVAREIVREHSWYGTDWIKVYMTEDFAAGGDVAGGFGGAWYSDGRMINVPSLTKEELQAVVDEAHERRMMVASHVYGGKGLRYVLETGVDIPMHPITSFDGSIGPDEEVLRMWKQPLPSGKARPVMHTIWDLADRKPGCDWTKYAETCVQNGMDARDTARTGGKTSRLKATEIAFRKFHQAGIKQVFGSGMHTSASTTPPGDQSMQFVFYVKWGMTPVESLQTATIHAAEYLNNDWDKKVGTIEKGKYADLVGVRGNPVQDISEMLRIKFVMKGGVVFRDELPRGPRDTTSSDSPQ